jgi:hypothetical protein
MDVLGAGGIARYPDGWQEGEEKERKLKIWLSNKKY